MLSVPVVFSAVAAEPLDGMLERPVPVPEYYRYRVAANTERETPDDWWTAPFWQNAETGAVDNLFWCPERPTRFVPETKFRLLYDREGIQVIFLVVDRYVLSREENQGKVWQDSCVEFFLRLPGPDWHFFNFELNPRGALVARYNRYPPDNDIHKRTEMFFTPDELRRFRVRSTLPEKILTADESFRCWQVRFRVPFALLEKYSRRKITPELLRQPWRANFYKIGENAANPHWLSWARLSERQFHLPEEFGFLYFQQIDK